jgi:signal transduction histidine kinase
VALCEETGVGGAVMALVEPGHDGMQIIAAHQPDGWGLAAALFHGETSAIALAAVQGRGFAQTADRSRAACAAAAGPYTLLLACECDEYRFFREGCISEALACSARIAGHAFASQLRLEEGERRRRLRQHTRLATTIHSDVIQRIFGASLVLDGDGDLEAPVRSVCAGELERALADLRSIIGSEPDELVPEDGDLCMMLRDLAGDGISIDVTPDAFSLAPIQEEIACSILSEAIRNARKHAHPRRIRVIARVKEGALDLRVSNDGIRRGRHGPASRPGVGLHLAAAEAGLGGGVLEFGPEDPGLWTLRLTLPQEERDESECCQSPDGGSGR